MSTHQHFQAPGESPAGLAITPLGPTANFADVLSWLPKKNATGWLMYPDTVICFDPASVEERPFLSAEISQGQHLSIHIRFDGAEWRGWRYEHQQDGTSHRVEELSFLAVEGAGVEAPGRTLNYRRYWHRTSDAVSDSEDIKVWTPHVTCFAGFGSKENDA